MLSEKQHIDDFFRQKEAAFSPDSPFVSAHWQQLRTQLAGTIQPSAVEKAGSHFIRHIGKYLGGLLTVAIIVFLSINSNRTNKKVITKTTKQPVTIVTPPTAPVAKQSIQPDTWQATKQQAAIETTKPLSAEAQGQQPETAKTITAIPAEQAQYSPTFRSVLNNADARVAINENAISASEKKVFEPDAKALLKSFFDELSKEEQVFYIQANRDTILVAKEGTRLNIRANSFGSETKPVKGEVKIIVREFFRYEDIIANKLSTTSNQQQLVTGGMLHISAQQNGEPVMIAPASTIMVNIPTNNYDSRMQLFTARDAPDNEINISALNWLPAGPFPSMLSWHSPTEKIFNLDYVHPFFVKHGSRKTTAKFRLSSDITIPKAEIIAQLKKRYGGYYDKIKLRLAQRAPGGRWAFEGYYSALDSVNIDLKKLLKNKHITVQDSMRYVNILKQDSLKYDMHVKLQKQYSFGITQFGWINCDRFLNDPRPKVNIAVNVGKEINATNCFSRLVFTRYQSVMLGETSDGQSITYRNLPEGEPAILITISVQNGKVVSNIQALSISNMEVSNLVFEPTTPESFKQQLRSLLPFQKQ